MFFSFFSKDPIPNRTGYLPAEGGHEVFYQEFGNPKGDAILVFHGGPGSCSKAKHADLFDLKKYHVVLFDQRGCGKSKAVSRLENNRTSDLVSDARRILDVLQIEKAHVYGGSWGATLALIFSQSHPHRIKSIMVSKTFLARKKDVEWISEGISRLYPDIMGRLLENVPSGTSMRKYYASQMRSIKESDRISATQLYGSYERMIGELSPSFTDVTPTQEHMEAFSLYMHYDENDYGVEENQILLRAKELSFIPTLILHNRLDLVCPVDQSYQLHKEIGGSKLIIVPDTGHGSELLEKTTKKEIETFLNEFSHE